MAIPLWQNIHLFALRLIDADCSRWSTSHVVDFSNVVVSMHPSNLWLDSGSTIDMVNPLGVCNLGGGRTCVSKSLFPPHSSVGPLSPSFPQVCPCAYHMVSSSKIQHVCPCAYHMVSSSKIQHVIRKPKVQQSRSTIV